MGRGPQQQPRRDYQPQDLFHKTQESQEPGWELLVGAQSRSSDSESAWLCLVGGPGNFLTFFQDPAKEPILGADNFSSPSCQVFVIGFSHIVPG